MNGEAAAAAKMRLIVGDYLPFGRLSGIGSCDDVAK